MYLLFGSAQCVFIVHLFQSDYVQSDPDVVLAPPVLISLRYTC